MRERTPQRLGEVGKEWMRENGRWHAALTQEGKDAVLARSIADQSQSYIVLWLFGVSPVARYRNPRRHRLQEGGEHSCERCQEGAQAACEG